MLNADPEPNRAKLSRKRDPYARPARWASGRKDSREHVLARDIRDALAKHVGGNPSAVQSILIERAAMLSVHLALLDRKMLESGSLSLHASRQYLAWSNALARTVRQLGIHGADLMPATLQDLIEP